MQLIYINTMDIIYLMVFMIKKEVKSQNNSNETPEIQWRRSDA